jgi:CheY-like chemotaxis protein
MESIGRLAGGIAHDFNNLLTVIAADTDLLHTRLRRDDFAAELIAEIRQAGERATALTRQLLAFSRREVKEPRAVDLNALVAETEKMLRRLLGEDIRLTTALAADLPPVKVDPDQWTQVLFNLAVNARDAMPDGGVLEVATRVEDVGDAEPWPGARPGRCVVLSVGDTGCGMTPEVRARIFEPFFTTKGVGRGTGLGLSVVHGIVAQSGGQVDVTSEPGGGTTFAFRLPALEGATPAAAEPRPAVDDRGTEAILLVEDDERVRRIAARGLRARGYTVIEAADGEQALSAFAARGDVALLITDVVMPGMHGRQLAEGLRAGAPALRVLYSSGYTDDAVVRRGVLLAEVDFLQKPYTLAALTRKVREILDRPAGRPALRGGP